MFLVVIFGEIVEWNMLNMIWWWDNKWIVGGGLYIILGVINFKLCKKIEIYLVICDIFYVSGFILFCYNKIFF